MLELDYGKSKVFEVVFLPNDHPHESKKLRLIGEEVDVSVLLDSSISSLEYDNSPTRQGSAIARRHIDRDQ